MRCLYFGVFIFTQLLNGGFASARCSQLLSGPALSPIISRMQLAERRLKLELALNALTVQIVKTPRNKERLDTFLHLKDLLERAICGAFEYESARVRYSLKKTPDVFQRIYDKLARELISDFPEIPRTIRQNLLSLVIDPEPKIIIKSENFAQNHEKSIFEERFTPPKVDTFSSEELTSGNARGFFFEKGVTFGSRKKAIPVVLLSPLPHSQEWLVAPIEQLQSKFRLDVVIFKIPTKHLRVSNFPESGAQTNYEILNNEPNQNYTFSKIFYKPTANRQDYRDRVYFLIQQLPGITPLE